MATHQTPYTDAPVPTPDAASGFSGTPGGFDLGPGSNGLRQTPWDNPVCPTPDGSSPPCADLGGPPIKQVETGGSTYENTTQGADLRMPPVNTIDKR